MINKEIYKFLWNHYKTNPIKREVLNKDKLQGGIGLLNVFFKAKSIFVNSLIKVFLKSDTECLMNYYLASRINCIFNFTSLPNRNSQRNTPYYDFVIDIIKQCKIHKDFPNMTSRSIYFMILPVFQSIVELKKP